jgi:hypothetical protein
MGADLRSVEEGLRGGSSAGGHKAQSATKEGSEKSMLVTAKKTSNLNCDLLCLLGALLVLILLVL